jgi:hypothetical protein
MVFSSPSSRYRVAVGAAPVVPTAPLDVTLAFARSNLDAAGVEGAPPAVGAGVGAASMHPLIVTFAAVGVAGCCPRVAGWPCVAGCWPCVAGCWFSVAGCCPCATTPTTNDDATTMTARKFFMVPPRFWCAGASAVNPEDASNINASASTTVQRREVRPRSSWRVKRPVRGAYSLETRNGCYSRPVGCAISLLRRSRPGVAEARSCHSSVVGAQGLFLPTGKASRPCSRSFSTQGATIRPASTIV